MKFLSNGLNLLHNQVPLYYHRHLYLKFLLPVLKFPPLFLSYNWRFGSQALAIRDTYRGSVDFLVHMTRIHLRVLSFNRLCLISQMTHHKYEDFSFYREFPETPA